MTIASPVQVRAVSRARTLASTPPYPTLMCVHVKRRSAENCRGQPCWYESVVLNGACAYINRTRLGFTLNSTHRSLWQSPEWCNSLPTGILKGCGYPVSAEPNISSAISPSFPILTFPAGRQGLPTAIVYGATSLFTSDDAPITAW